MLFIKDLIKVISGSMKGRLSDWFLALAAGFLLTLMIDFNSTIAKQSTPLFSSWVAHGVGSVTSLLLVFLFRKSNRIFRSANSSASKSPLWSYLGGIPGALTVVLATIAVNSELGISSVIALMLVGQVVFGIICDLFGLFGIPRRRFDQKDFVVVSCVLLGSGLIIFTRS